MHGISNHGDEEGYATSGIIYGMENGEITGEKLTGYPRFRDGGISRANPSLDVRIREGIKGRTRVRQEDLFELLFRDLGHVLRTSHWNSIV